MMDIDKCRSFATRTGLLKALAQFPASFRYVVVCTTKGRYTAIFNASTLDGQLAAVAHAGFMVIG